MLMLRSNEIHNGPFHSPWFWDANLTGGGAAIDMGIHGVNTLEWIMGSKIKRVYAETEVLKWKDYCKNGAEDTAIAVLRFENGGLAEVVISWAISGGMDVRLEVFGDQGTAYVSTTHEAGGLRIFSNNGYGKSYEEKQASSRMSFLQKAGVSLHQRTSFSRGMRLRLSILSIVYVELIHLPVP